MSTVLPFPSSKDDDDAPVDVDEIGGGGHIPGQTGIYGGSTTIANGGYGNLVIIRHYNGLETYYAHLSKINVEPNSVIKAGDVLGEGGCTGSRCTGPHLHFETRYKDRPFNPQEIIAFDQGCLSSESIMLTKSNFVIGKSNSVSTTFNGKTTKTKANLKYSYKERMEII